jgi:hypothetical protein
MGLIFKKDGDVNIVGVVGSSRDDDETPPPRSRDRSDADANTGIVHRGRGNVYVNGVQQ